MGKLCSLGRVFLRASTTVLLSFPPILLGQAAQAQSGPDSVGQWSPIYNWPNVATHANLLPDGKVLTWFTGDTYYPGANEADIVTIAPGGQPSNFTAVDNRRSNMFCSGHAFLPNGKLVVIGGRSGPEAYGHWIRILGVDEYMLDDLFLAESMNLTDVRRHISWELPAG